MSSRTFTVLFLLFVACAMSVELAPKHLSPRSLLTGILLALGFGCLFAAILVGLLEG